MTHFSRIAGICMLFIVSACSPPQSAVVTSEGAVISGEYIPLSGQKAIIGEEIEFPAGEAVVILKDSLSCIGTVTFSDDRLVSVQHSRGVQNFSFSEIEMIVWQRDAGGRQSKTLEVHADSTWTATGLLVTTGSFISVHARGTVMMKTGMSGPEGRDLSSTTIALEPRATNGELIMQVNNTPPVAVGKMWTGTVEYSGELFFAVNIPRTDYPDENSGSYEVTVDVLDGVYDGSMIFYPEVKWDVGHSVATPNQ